MLFDWANTFGFSLQVLPDLILFDDIKHSQQLHTTFTNAVSQWIKWRVIGGLNLFAIWFLVFLWPIKLVASVQKCKQWTSPKARYFVNILRYNFVHHFQKPLNHSRKVDISIPLSNLNSLLILQAYHIDQRPIGLNQSRQHNHPRTLFFYLLNEPLEIS